MQLLSAGAERVRPVPITGSPPPQLCAAARDLREWLFGAALPLWWKVGADGKAGGFHELLGQDGIAPAAPRRARVQARQAFVFACAGLSGWDGPWREAAGHALSYLLDKYRRPDGLFRALVSTDGTSLDETARLYDQAFVLLCLAKLQAASPQDFATEPLAQELLGRFGVFRHGPGAFREFSDQPYQSNALMHLLEAALTWMEVSPSPVWRRLAEQIVDHARTRLFDEEKGCVREFFDDGWAPAPSEAGRIVDPGHQFEWCWLLSEWSRLTGDLDAALIGRRLFDAGRRGVCERRAIVMDQIWDDFSTKSETARLWPQTEWLKAALLIGEAEADWGPALAAAQALSSYLETPLPGLWWDVCRPDGRMEHQPAPASSLYHIVGSILELHRRARA